MARTGWHDGLSISKVFFSRVEAEDISLERAALLAGVDNEDPKKMRRLALWRSLSDFNVDFDIPEMTALKMQEFVESPAPDHLSPSRIDPQSLLFTTFVEACTERDMDAAEMRIAAGLPEPSRFKRWMKSAAEGISFRMPEETRVAMSEWLVSNNVAVPEGVLIQKEMIGIHAMLATAGAVKELPTVSIPAPEIQAYAVQPDAPRLEPQILSPDMEAEPTEPRFSTAAELCESLPAYEGASLQLSWGF